MEFITKFTNYLLSQKGSASQATVKNYLADVKQFISWVEGAYKKPFTPAEITLQTIQEFKEAKKSLSASSVDRHISSLRKFFTFLKLDGSITDNPFEQKAQATQPQDPWHIHGFKDYLYVYNASHLTIKNYLIDVKQFLSWAETVLRTQDAWHVADKDVFKRIDAGLVDAYKMRLLQEKVFSPASINRKLSSLRKYLAWAQEQGYLQNQAQNPTTVAQKMQAQASLNKTAAEQAAKSSLTAHTYSKIPPVRLFQKLTNAGTLTFDLLIVSPIAHAFRRTNHHAWVRKGKPIFVPSPLSMLKSPKNLTSHIKNISKEFYAPLSISIKDLPWYKKAIYHTRYTRPQWYHKYHQLAIAHYFNWAVLIIFSVAIGVGMYNTFVQHPDKSLAALPTSGTRVLSFQGRLTDASDNPITSPSWIRFIVYNNGAASSSARLWEEVDKVTPDQDGIFSLLLGSDGSGGQATACSPTPPSSPATGACGIPQSLFAQNSALWLGVTVENTAELTPREQLATVAYASNSETLQGLPPITQSGAGTQNVVLALNSSGNLAIGADTTFQSTSGQFTLSGNTLVLNTNAGTNGNITLAPDGTGFVDIQRPLQNTSNNGNIASVKNALEIDDLTAILATSSGQSALTIDQNGTGPIISASHSGTAEFTLDSSGNGTFNGNVTGQTIYIGGGTTYYINNNTSHLNSLTLAANLTVSGNVASDLIPDGNGTRSLGDPTHQWLNIYGQNIYSNGQLLTSLWQENLGALSPIHTLDDLILGGTATSDAKFQVFGSSYNTSPAGTASTSGYLSFQGTPGSQTVFKQQLLNGSNLGFYPSVGGEAGISATPALYVANTGKIGIGTNNPVNSLQIGNVGSTGYSSNNIAVGDGSNAIAIQAGTTGYLTASGNLVLGANTNTTNQLFLSTTGNVGIGTNTLLATLDVRGNSGTTAVSSISGQTTFAAEIVDNKGLGDLFTASTSGLTKFTILRSGSIKDSNYTTDKGVLFSDSNGLFTQTAQGATHTFLRGNGSSAPTFNAIDLTADVGSSILPLANGGTGANLTGDQGGLVYFNSSTTLAVVNHTVSVGQCLLSGGTGTPTWGSCGSGSGSSFWTLNAANGTIYPINTTLDLFVGGTATASAKFAVTNIAGSLTPAASVSATTASGGTGTGVTIGGDGSIQSLINGDLTIGGNTTGGISLKPSNGNGVVTLQSDTLNTTKSTFNLVNTTANTINFGGAANSLNIGAVGGTSTFRSATIDDNQASLALFATPTTLDIGGASQATNLKGNTTLGTTTSNTVTLNGLVSGAGVNNAVQPVGNGATDLGSATHYWATVYANNFISPVTGGVSGFWQLTSGVLSPVNAWNDLAVGGNATGSATPFQVFGTPYTTDGSINSGIITAGTATTAGNLTFRGSNASINLLNGTGLTIYESGGGDKGLGALVTLSNSGNLTLRGDLAVNGSNLTSTSTTFNVFPGTVSTLNIGNNSGTTNLKGNVAIGTSGSNTILFNGLVASDISPFPGGPYNLGGYNNRWGDVFATNLRLPVAGGQGGYWTLGSSVLSPTYNWNDLAVGGTATGSATAFQVFANAYAADSGTIPAGTATSSGNLTLRGTAASQTPFAINLLNGSSLSVKRSVGGDNGLSTIFTFGNDGNVTDTGNLAVNGSQLTSTTGTFSLLNTGVTNLSFAGAATTLSIGNSGGTATVNGALTVAGATNLNGNITLGDATGDQITVNGRFLSSLIPNAADAINLGDATHEWDTLYIRQIVTPSSGGIAGFWQLSNQGVLAPANLPNDVAIGGVATSTAKFQIFANPFTTDATINSGIIPAGTATTSGNLSFNGVAGSQTPFQVNYLNGSSLGFYKSAGGDIGITSATPSLFLAANGNIGVGTNGPSDKLDIAGNATASGNLSFRGTNTLHNFNLLNGGQLAINTSVGGPGTLNTALFIANGNNTTAGFVGINNTTPLTALDVVGSASVSANLTLRGTNTNHTFNILQNGTLGFYNSVGGDAGVTAANPTLYIAPPTNSALVGTVAIGTNSPLTASALTINKDSLGNALLSLKQLSPFGGSGPGDLITASNSAGTAQFTVTNSGNIYGRVFTDLDNTIYYLDPAGLTVSASIAGSMTFTPAAEHDINFLNGSNINFQGSVGGDALLTSKLFITGNSGFVGIGTTAPSDSLDIAGNATESGNLSFRGTNTTHNINALNGGSFSFNTSVGGPATLNPSLFIEPGTNTTAGNVGINNNAPTRNIDVVGDWGGNVTTASDSTAGGTHTHTVTANTLIYYFNYPLSAPGGNSTVVWNISGPQDTDGSFFFVYLRANSSSATNTANANIQVNGGTTRTGVTGAVNSAPRWAGALMAYFNGEWNIVASRGSAANQNFDLAELIPFANPKPVPGALLTPHTTNHSFDVESTSKEYDQKTIGIVTTNPSITFGEDTSGLGQANPNDNTDGTLGIALSGRVPVIITSLNGPIEQGDSIVSSPLVGAGMKPLRASQTVGKALEGFDPSQTTCANVSSYDAINWPSDNGLNTTHPCFGVPVSGFDVTTQSVLKNEYKLQSTDVVYVGKTMVLINNGYEDPNVYLTTTGNLNIADTQPSQNFTIPHYYSLADILGHPLTQMGAFLELAVGNLRAGSIQTQQLFTNSLAIATANVTIAGQSLHDYVQGIVEDVVAHNPSNNVAQSNSVKTNLISPLGDGQIALRFNNSKIEIAKDASSSAVASIDNNGNATFSGSLNSGNLAVNGDATVAGTLHAGKIVAEDIEGLQAKLGTLSAQNITNVTNIYMATPTGTLADGNGATGSNGNSSQSGQLLANSGNFTDIASFSAYFAYVPNLKATTGIFTDGLTSLGGTSLADTTIDGQLSVSGQLILADNSINVLTGDLELQPLRQGGIAFAGHKVYIDTNGNLSVDGNATFMGNLAVNTLSPIAGHDLNINLQNGAATGSANANFNVKNASGSAVFALNQLGDLVASGTATVNKLNFNLVQPALAISDTEVVATGSAGTAFIKAHQREVTIDNPGVTTQSLIYITPVGTDQIPYLERQVSGTSFTVGIPNAQNAAVNFNWLIVN